VRVATLSGFGALVYLGVDDRAEVRSWVGWDPGTFGQPPPFWESFPLPLRGFLREVHAGFAVTDDDIFGPLQPRMTETIASRAGEPDGLDDWDAIHEIPSTRLVVVGTDGGALLYRVSPDIPADRIALIYGGDVDEQDLGAKLDLLMLNPCRS
jgi:hypothetical protein